MSATNMGLARGRHAATLRHMDMDMIVLNDGQASEVEDFALRGSFASPAEVIDAALSALRERFADDQYRTARFHALIDAGLLDLQEGRYEDVPLDKLDAWLSDLAATKR